MSKTINIKKSILSASLALALAAGLAPATALADTALATTLASSASSTTNFARTMHAFINQDASKVYAATARANGDEAAAEAIEAEAAAEVAAAETAAAASVSAPQESASQATTAPATVSAPSPSTIQIGASVIPFVQCYLAPAAPDDTAGLWWGNSSTTDGDLGYFVGHNPGVFAPVVSLTQGDQVTVTDGAGASHTYTVIDIFDVANTTALQQIQDRICGHGESIAMQACIQGGAYYRIVVAA